MARRGYSKRLPVLFLESGEVALPAADPTSQRAMPKAAAPTPSPRYNGITVQSAYTGHECLFDTRYQYAVWISSHANDGEQTSSIPDGGAYRSRQASSGCAECPRTEPGLTPRRSRRSSVLPKLRRPSPILLATSFRSTVLGDDKRGAAVVVDHEQIFRVGAGRD